MHAATAMQRYGVYRLTRAGPTPQRSCFLRSTSLCSGSIAAIQSPFAVKHITERCTIQYIFDRRAPYLKTTWNMYICVRIFVNFWSVFAFVSLRKRTVWSNAQRITGEGRPGTVIKVWARSVACVAYGVRLKFFSAGVDDTISRVFNVRFCFVSYVEMLVFLAHRHLF